MICVFLTLRSDKNWEIMINRSEIINFKTHQHTFLMQISEVLHFLNETLEEKYETNEAIIWSSKISREMSNNLHYAFPNFTLLTINHSGLRYRFNEIFERSTSDVLHIKNKKSDTIYICSDASVDVARNVGAWGWVSSNGHKSEYGYGNTRHSSSSTAELEGICQAIVAHKNSEFKTIHVYSDCKQEVARISSYLKSRQPEIAILELPKEVQKIAAKAFEVCKRIDVKISWVRGHKRHRLNEAADFISGIARKEIFVVSPKNDIEKIFSTLKYFTG